MFAALAVSRLIERQTGWSIHKFVRTARRYRTVEIQAGDRRRPIPDDFCQPLTPLTARRVRTK